MPDYLPLCTPRQDLLPAACRLCAWWLTCGAPPGENSASAVRMEWMRALEPTWGSTGLILPQNGPGAKQTAAGRLPPAACIHYAPVYSVPRLRELPLGPLSADAALVFCLRVDDPGDGELARRILQKALIQLRLRGTAVAYGYASVDGGAFAEDCCEFFARDFLGSCGFRLVGENGRLSLMRADLQGMAAVLNRVETVLKRVLGVCPTPSPASWTRREM